MRPKNGVKGIAEFFVYPDSEVTSNFIAENVTPKLSARLWRIEKASES